MRLNKIFVQQGNGNGLFIDKESEELVLATADLCDCIAVCLVGDENVYLIHSDANNAKGVGATQLQDGIKGLGVDLNAEYEIGLFGGNSDEAISHKLAHIKSFMPNISCKITHSCCDAAYVTNNGIMAHTKRSLAEKLSIELDDLEIVSPPLLKI